MRRSFLDAWRGRPPETTGIISAVAVLAVVLYGGGRLVGLPLPVPGLVRPAAEVRLDSPVPSISRDGEINLAGTTRPGASATALVDHVTVDRMFTGSDGRFSLRLTLPRPGEHRVRIEVRYGHQRIDELLETTTRWVTGDVITPKLLAVEWWAELGGYYIVVGATPGVEIRAVGGTLEPLGSRRIGPTGRAEYLISTDGVTRPTLAAADEEGVASAPTEPLDLSVLAAEPPSVNPVDRVVSTVTFGIDRRDVTRTWVATLDPDRVELGTLTGGTIDARAFLEAVTGPAGIAPLGSSGCLVGTIRAGQSNLEIGDEASVTLVDSFPGVITQWNGFSDSPGLSLCLPRGMPARRDSGFVEVRLRDYVFDSVSIPPTSATTVSSDSGVVERVYRWDRIPFATSVEIRLGPAAPSILSLVPRLATSADADLGDGPTRFVDALLWRFLRSLGTVLLLGIVTSRLAAGLGSRGPVARDILVVSLALGLAPALGQLDLASLSFANVPALLWLKDDSLRGTLAEWLLTALVTAAGGVAYWLLRRRRRRFWQAVTFGLVLAGLGWMGLTVLGRATLALAGAWSVDDPEAVRLATWISGLAVLTVPLTYLVVAIGRLSDPGRPRPTGPRLLLTALLASVVAALLSVPTGTEGSIGSTQEVAWSWMRQTLANLAALASFTAPLAILILVVVQARRAWATASSASVDQGDPSPPPEARWPRAAPAHHLLPALAASIFAGFAITTSGGLQPLSFAVALVVFTVWLRPAGASVAAATRARVESPAAPARGRRAARAVTTQPAATQPAEAASAGRSIWSNVRFALTWGVVFLILPLVLYVAQYPIAGVTRKDPLYLQHVLVTLGQFALSWLFVALAFGLAIDYLRSTSGLRKGLLFGLAMLAVTLPFQVVYGILAVFSPLELAVWVFDVIAFTTLLGAVFDLRELHEKEPLDLFRPKTVATRLSEQSGLPALVAAASVIVVTIATTISGLLTDQVVQIVTQLVTPFLPVSAR